MSNLFPYESPEMEIIAIVPEEFICGSGGIDSLDEDEYGWKV